MKTQMDNDKKLLANLDVDKEKLLLAGAMAMSIALAKMHESGLPILEASKDASSSIIRKDAKRLASDAVKWTNSINIIITDDIN